MTDQQVPFLEVVAKQRSTIEHLKTAIFKAQDRTNELGKPGGYNEFMRRQDVRISRLEEELACKTTEIEKLAKELVDSRAECAELNKKGERLVGRLHDEANPSKVLLLRIRQLEEKASTAEAQLSQMSQMGIRTISAVMEKQQRTTQRNVDLRAALAEAKGSHEAEMSAMKDQMDIEMDAHNATRVELAEAKEKIKSTKRKGARRGR